MTEDNIGDRYFQETKYNRSDFTSLRSNSAPARPDLYKEYPDQPRLTLPPPNPPDNLLSLDQALRHRKSIRRYADKPLSLEQLSYLIWATTGIQRTEGGFHFRTAPSAGALYPVETYLAVNNVSGVTQGIYHYAIRPHTLERLKEGETGSAVARATMGQRICREAPVVFIWTAIFQRTRFRYLARAYRYIHLDAGHIAQNLALTATAMGLASCQVGAYFDDEVNALIGIDGTGESVIYLSVAGYQT